MRAGKPIGFVHIKISAGWIQKPNNEQLVTKQ